MSQDRDLQVAVAVAALLPPVADGIAMTPGPDGEPYMAVADTVLLLRAIAGACRRTADYPGCDLRTAAHGLDRQADDLDQRAGSWARRPASSA